MGRLAAKAYSVKSERLNGIILMAVYQYGMGAADLPSSEDKDRRILNLSESLDVSQPDAK